VATVKTLYLAVTAALIALVSQSALAAVQVEQFVESETRKAFYAGNSIAFPNIEMQVSGSTVKTKNTLVGAIIGYRPFKNVGIEVRGYGDASSEDINVDYHFNVLGELILPVDQYMELYGMFGIGKTKLSYFNQISDEEEDIVYGVGVSVNNGTAIRLNLEWQYMMDGEINGGDAELGSFNMNFMYYF
jgi:hypothetical protein